MTTGIALYPEAFSLAEQARTEATQKPPGPAEELADRRREGEDQ